MIEIYLSFDSEAAVKFSLLSGNKEAGRLKKQETETLIFGPESIFDLSKSRSKGKNWIWKLNKTLGSSTAKRFINHPPKKVE